MDTYAADVATLTDHLDLNGAIHVGHSTGGGEVARYVARAKRGRVAKAVLIGAVPPLMLQTSANPGGLPRTVFDGFRQGVAANRSQLHLDIPSGPFYGFNRPGAKVSQGTVRHWWRQGMAGGAKAHYDCIAAFSETDFTDDLKRIVVPVLLMHGEDDQIVPIADSALLGIKLLKNGALKTYPGFPHGMATTHADQIRPAGLHQELNQPSRLRDGEHDDVVFPRFVCRSRGSANASTRPAAANRSDACCERPTRKVQADLLRRRPANAVARMASSARGSGSGTSVRVATFVNTNVSSK